MDGFETEKILGRWMLTIGTTVVPFWFDTKREAIAYAKRKIKGQDPEWPMKGNPNVTKA